MPYDKHDYQLLVRFMTMNYLRSMVWHKVVAVTMQVCRRCCVISKYSVHLSGVQLLDRDNIDLFEVMAACMDPSQSWATLGRRAVAPVTCHSQKMNTPRCNITNATIKEPYPRNGSYDSALAVGSAAIRKCESLQLLRLWYRPACDKCLMLCFSIGLIAISGHNG